MFTHTNITPIKKGAFFLMILENIKKGKYSIHLENKHF